jgi:hypothetical protein
MVCTAVSDDLAKVSENTGGAKEAQLEERLEELSQRVRVRYPDNFYLRDELLRLSRLVTELARGVAK